MHRTSSRFWKCSDKLPSFIQKTANENFELLVEITEPRLIGINVNDNEIKAFLTDGRTISVPLAWSWRLSEATPKQRQNYEIIGDGQGVHWPDVDEDISVEGMLYGVPARRPSAVSV